MIYIIADMKSFSEEISQNRVIILNFLNKKDDIEIISDIDFHIDKIRKMDKIIYFTIRTYSHSSVRFIERMIEKMIYMENEKYIYVEDFYNTDEISEFCKKYKLKNVIYSMRHKYYENRLKKKNSNINISILHHYFDLKMFPTEMMKKKYDLLIYGSVNKKIYPLRSYLKDLFVKNNKKYKIKIIEMNKNYKLNSESIIGEELYSEIGSSYITVATSGKYDFFTKKYQEIPLSGSMILGNIPNNYKHMYNNHNIIRVERKDEDEILKKIDDYLERKDELIRKTKELQNEMRNIFELENVYKELKGIICEM